MEYQVKKNIRNFRPNQCITSDEPDNDGPAQFCSQNLKITKLCEQTAQVSTPYYARVMSSLEQLYLITLIILTGCFIRENIYASVSNDISYYYMYYDTRIAAVIFNTSYIRISVDM